MAHWVKDFQVGCHDNICRYAAYYCSRNPRKPIAHMANTLKNWPPPLFPPS
jgi:hypothetical protein